MSNNNSILFMNFNDELTNIFINNLNFNLLINFIDEFIFH